VGAPSSLGLSCEEEKRRSDPPSPSGAEEKVCVGAEVGKGEATGSARTSARENGLREGEWKVRLRATTLDPDR
jgi:hypothetical protein